MAATIQQVARKAGVSTATVSRAFNVPSQVALPTRRRVEAAARDLVYVPNASARTLRTQRSRVLGVVLPTWTNPVFAECLEGIAHTAAAAGYSIVPVTTDYQLDLEERSVNLLLAGNVDGVILVVSNPASSPALRRLGEARVPYVLAYNRHARHPCVSVDSTQAVADLVARLVAMGHRRISMVSGQLCASDRAQQRYRGFRQGMRAAGLRPRLIEVPFVASALESLQRFVRERPAPQALVCSNDLLAIRSIRAVRQCGLRVPEDVSVAGFDGIALGEDLTPMLSTVVQPNEEIGRRSVRLVVDALATGVPLAPRQSETLACRFREGESCTSVRAKRAAAGEPARMHHPHAGSR